MAVVRVFLLSLCILVIQQAAFSQRRPRPVTGGPRYNTGIYHPRLPRQAPSYQAAYLGFSGGINNPTGVLGLNIDLAFTNHISLFGGAGLSTWGYKFALEVRSYLDSCNRGWALMAGITYNTGRDGLLVNGIETTSGEQTVIINQRPQNSASLSIGHFFNMGRRGTSRFLIQVGYSIPLSEVVFVNQGPPFQAPLTDKGRSTILALAPGGFILGFGFSFGTGRNHK